MTTILFKLSFLTKGQNIFSKVATIYKTETQIRRERKEEGKMEKFDEVILFNIASKLEIPDLINFSILNNKTKRLIYNKDTIWDYNLKKEDEKDVNDFCKIIQFSNKRKLLQILYELKVLDNILNLRTRFRFRNRNATFLEIYNLKELYLNNEKIYEKSLKSIPKEIGCLINLEKLNISNNRECEHFPKEICKLTNLKQLFFNYCKLKEIPKEIGKLVNLEELYLNDNEIKRIPVELFNLTKLKDLYLDANKIKEVPAEIENLQNLKTLCLSYNLIEILPITLEKLNLRELFVSHNLLSKIPKIKLDSDIRGIYLSRNKIKDIRKEICCLKNLRNLFLDHNQIKKVPVEIDSIPHLEMLDIRYNPLSVPLPSRLSELIESNLMIV